MGRPLGYTVEQMIARRAARVWSDANPFYLLIALPNGRGVEIDVGERHWQKRYANYLRVRAQWALCRKDDSGVVFIIEVFDGERPYYAARHIGALPLNSDAAGVEVTAYGIGKKRTDGHVDRLWVLPGGLITTGDDVMTLARGFLGGVL